MKGVRERFRRADRLWRSFHGSDDLTFILTAGAEGLSRELLIAEALHEEDGDPLRDRANEGYNLVVSHSVYGAFLFHSFRPLDRRLP